MLAIVQQRSEGQPAALPVETYAEAVAALVVIALDQGISDQAYDVAASMVARIYWRTEKRVRRDVKVAARRIGGF